MKGLFTQLPRQDSQEVLASLSSIDSEASNFVIILAHPFQSKRPMLGALRFPYKVIFASANRYVITLVANDANRKKYGYKYMPIVKFVTKGSHTVFSRALALTKTQM